MRIFITGGTGYIGGYVVRRLIQKNHELVCLVRSTSNTSELKKLGVKLVTGDVTDKETLSDGMFGCNWVVNLANIYSWWVPDKRIYTKVNIEGTKNVMECVLEAGASKVVHTSTAYVG